MGRRVGAWPRWRWAMAGVGWWGLWTEAGHGRGGDGAGFGGRRDARSVLIRAAVGSGESRRAAAERLGVSTRTVRRALAIKPPAPLPFGLGPEHAAAWEEARSLWKPRTVAEEAATARFARSVVAVNAAATGADWARAMRAQREAAADLCALGLGG